MKELAEIEYSTGPAKISRDDTRRRVVVSVNVRNRDLESVVTDIEAMLDENLELPPGYCIDYGGQFENLRNASRRLKIAVPIALLLIFIFLHFAFGSIKEAALVFTAIPLSIVGGVFLLWIRGMPFSISAGIGFIALFGIAVLNGIVLIEHLKDLKKQGIMDMRERVLKGTRERLRPVLLTASAAALGFLPMAISTSAGAEVQRPLATVVIGGLVTSTLLTMLALPLMYAIVDNVKGIQLWPPKLKREKLLPLILLLLMPAFAMAQNNATEQGTQHSISLDEALEIGLQNNKELAAYQSLVEESEALIKTAFSIDKTHIYYSYDENNIADNNYPIGVIGGEQRFDFPSLYFAQRSSNRIASSMVKDEMEKKRKILTRDISKAYNDIQYLQNKQKKFQFIDSIYTPYSRASALSFEIGETAYLDMLHAQTKQNEVRIDQKQLLHDLNIAMANLAALIYYDSAFVVPYTTLEAIPVLLSSSESDPGYQQLQHHVQQQEALIKVEKNKLLPDVTLGYFNGTNRYANSRNYQGVEVGLGIPLFFGEQRARVKAGKYAWEAALNMKENYERVYENKAAELMKNLEKYQESITYFEETGHQLASELFRSAKMSYAAGEIDFFRFIQSVESAVRIELSYLENLYKYNEIVLEINYLTF